MVIFFRALLMSFIQILYMSVQDKAKNYLDLIRLYRIKTQSGLSMDLDDVEAWLCSVRLMKLDKLTLRRAIDYYISMWRGQYRYRQRLSYIEEVTLSWTLMEAMLPPSIRRS